MADPYELMEMEGYNRGPEEAIRNRKLKMEEELLIKLGAKKELIELHPLILSSRLERAQNFVDLNYTRVNPPFTERSYVSRNPWHSEDQALRQMSNPSRRGPRDFVLPNLCPPTTTVKTIAVPPNDAEFMARREVIIDRLHKLLEEWPVYERRAFPPLISRLSTLKELPARRELTKANLDTLGSGRGKRKSYSCSSSSNKSSFGKRTSRRIALRKKTRWTRMIQETMLHVKASHVKLPGQLPKSELRVYVSSTPDLHEEREFLEEVAYPKLKELCEKIGLNCHFVDMRKGSGILSNDIDTFDLIETELQQCRQLSIGPYFVSLLGHQLDDQKLPGFLSKDVYEKIRETLVKEDIIGVEMFDDAYRLDSNRVPPIYIKQPLRAINQYQGPEYVEQILLTALNSAIGHIKDNGEEIQDFYTWSAVVKEVETGILKSYNPKRETLCFLFGEDRVKTPEVDEEKKRNGVEKEGSDVEKNGSDAITNPVDRLRQNVQTHYRKMASKGSVLTFKDGRKTISYLRSLSDTFIANMASILKLQVRREEFDVTSHMTEGSEALQHVRVALNRSTGVLDSWRSLTKIKEILAPGDESPKTIVVTGVAGQGKTTLMSQIAKNALLWNPQRKTVHRCLGLTLRSSSLYRGLESLNKQLNFLYALDNNFPEYSNLNSAISVFCDTLQLVSQSRKGRGNLLLVLDNLECFRDLDGHTLMKIVNSIREGITLVVSMSSESALNSVLKTHPCVKIIPIVSFNGVEMNEFIKFSLSSLNRRVTHDQLSMVMRSLPSDSIPAYFDLIFNIIKRWPSHTLHDMQRFSGVIENDLEAFLVATEAEVGKAFTRFALSLLVSSRFGLSDSEIVHLLSEDGELLNEVKAEQDESVSVVEGFSCQLQLSRLVFLLGRFVVEIKIEGETVLQIVSSPLKRCIHNRYLQEGFFHSIHNKLATFFLFIRRGLLLSSKDISEKRFQDLSKYQWRMMRSVPYHLCFSSSDVEEVWASLKEKVFFNFSWLVNEIYSGFYMDLLDDIRFALEHVDLDPDIQYLQQILVSIAQTAVHNPVSLASVFACHDIQGSEDGGLKDSVRDVVQAARIWLKQVHTQALTPVHYTMDKVTRLLIKKNCMSQVTKIWSNGQSVSIVIRRNNAFYLSNMVNGEETKLASFEDTILDSYVTANQDVFVSTIDKNEDVTIHVASVDKGSNVRSMILDKDDIKWFDFRSTSESYICDDEGIQLVNFDKNKTKTVWAQKSPWLGSHVSSSATTRIISITVEEKMKVHILTLKSNDLRMISFKQHSSLNPYCHRTLLTTKDGKYLVLVFEREAVVVDLIKSEETETFSHNGLPIANAVLSRSHEHIFLAYMNGAITCHVLYSGNTSMLSKMIPRSSRTMSDTTKKSDSRARGSASPNKSSMSMNSKSRGFDSSKPNLVEIISQMVTSEDDHFLFCGTNAGMVYMIHVPTGHQVVSILAQPSVTQSGESISNQPYSITQLVYLTNREQFQHLTIVSEDGSTSHWNLRPLIKQCRGLIQPFIQDDDLLTEEQPKLNLRVYYKRYASQATDRVFLNGPDIAAFYKESPGDIFAPVVALDPAFRPPNDWENSGSLSDLGPVAAFVCGRQLGDTLITVTLDHRIARWSLHDGTLVWSHKLTSGQRGGKCVQAAALVYYDQALLITSDDKEERGLNLSVVYLGDGQQSKSLTQSGVIGYWTSQDRCQVLMLCQDKSAAIKMPQENYLGSFDTVQTPPRLTFSQWDLINASCNDNIDMDLLDERLWNNENVLYTTISPSLSQIVTLSLVPQPKDDNPDIANDKTPGHKTSAVKVDSKSAIHRKPGTFPTVTSKRDGDFDDTIAGIRSRLSTSTFVRRSSNNIVFDNSFLKHLTKSSKRQSSNDSQSISRNETSNIVSSNSVVSKNKTDLNNRPEDNESNAHDLEISNNVLKETSVDGLEISERKRTNAVHDRHKRDTNMNTPAQLDAQVKKEQFGMKILLTWSVLGNPGEMKSDGSKRSTGSHKSETEIASSDSVKSIRPDKGSTLVDFSVNDNLTKTDLSMKEAVEDVDEVFNEDNNNVFAKNLPKRKISSRVSFSIPNEVDDKQSFKQLTKNWCHLTFEITTVSFVGESDLALGTTSGYVVLLNVPTFHMACLLMEETPILLPTEELGLFLQGSKEESLPPHRGPVTFVGTSDDGSALLSADVSAVCVWNPGDRKLIMVVKFDSGYELTNMLFSKDASIVVMVTNHRVIHVWTSVGQPREIATYKTTFDLYDLALSPDCHKLVVKGENQTTENVLEIFEIKNVDDILVHIDGSRRQSGDDGGRRGSELLSPKRKTSRQMSEQRRISATGLS